MEEEEHILLQTGAIRKSQRGSICGRCGTSSSYPEYISSEGGAYITYNSPGDLAPTPSLMDSFVIKDRDMGARLLAWFDEDTEERTGR